MPIWPCEFAHLSVCCCSFALLLANFVMPIYSQATCAFLHADFAEFLVDNTPDEPKIADDLLLCRRPSHQLLPSVSCCTRQMETKFVQFAQDQLHSAVHAEFGLIRNFFTDWSATFRTEFSHALNRTERTLRHIFQRTYGRFFTQNIAAFLGHSAADPPVIEQQRSSGNPHCWNMFDSFFDQLRSLLRPSPCSLRASFDDAFRQLVHRIFLAEFALLNPLRSSDLPSREQCMLTFFPAFAPFGSVPDVIATLHNRTFAAWRSLIDALDSGGEVVQSLERSFSLSSHCVASVVRMRFCPICHGADSPNVRPCPAHCHDVLRRCLHNLTTINPQWDGLIGSLVRLSSSLASVHNPHLSLAPFPFQLSEAIMHFQENAQILSGRILFRCFGDELQKIGADDEQINLRARRKRTLRREKEENLEEEEEEEEMEVEEEERDEREEEQRRIENGPTFESDGDSSIGWSTAASLPPVLISIISMRRSIDRFVDRLTFLPFPLAQLRRMKGFWRELGRMMCEEGGLQSPTTTSNVRRTGEACWEGMEVPMDDALNEWKSQQTVQTANFTREMMQLEEINKRMLLANGMEMATAKEGRGVGTEWAQSANSTDFQQQNEENSGNSEHDNDDDDEDDDYHSYESVGKWWQWTEMEKGRTNGQIRTSAEGIGTAVTIAAAIALWSSLIL